MCVLNTATIPTKAALQTNLTVNIAISWSTFLIYYTYYSIDKVY